MDFELTNSEYYSYYLLYAWILIRTLPDIKKKSIHFSRSKFIKVWLIFPIFICFYIFIANEVILYGTLPLVLDKISHPFFKNWINMSGLPITILTDLITSKVVSNATEISDKIKSDPLAAWYYYAIAFPFISMALVGVFIIVYILQVII